MYTKLNRKIIENLFLSYLIALIIGCFAFTPILFLNITQLDALTDQPLILGLITISSISMKFISGLGISLMFSMVCILGFRLSSNWIKGNRNRSRLIKLLMLISAFFIFLYGIRIIFGGVEIRLGGIRLIVPDVTGVEKLLNLIFGMYVLIFFLYILPILREKYQPFDEETRTDRIKGKLGNAKFSMWRGYKTRIRKDYGQVYASEYERYRERIVDIREQLSGILLLFFMVIWFIFPPIAAIMMVLWLRIFSQDKKPYTLAEKALLILLILGTLVISTYIFLFFNILEIVILMNVAYAIGIFIGMIALILIILTS